MEKSKSWNVQLEECEYKLLVNEEEQPRWYKHWCHIRKVEKGSFLICLYFVFTNVMKMWKTGEIVEDFLEEKFDDTNALDEMYDIVRLRCSIALSMSFGFKIVVGTWGIMQSLKEGANQNAFPMVILLCTVGKPCLEYVFSSGSGLGVSAIGELQWIAIAAMIFWFMRRAMKEQGVLDFVVCTILGIIVGITLQTPMIPFMLCIVLLKTPIISRCRDCLVIYLCMATPAVIEILFTHRHMTAHLLFHVILVDGDSRTPLQQNAHYHETNLTHTNPFPFVHTDTPSLKIDVAGMVFHDPVEVENPLLAHLLLRVDQLYFLSSLDLAAALMIAGVSTMNQGTLDLGFAMIITYNLVLLGLFGISGIEWAILTWVFPNSKSVNSAIQAEEASFINLGLAFANFTAQIFLLTLLMKIGLHLICTCFGNPFETEIEREEEQLLV